MRIGWFGDHHGDRAMVLDLLGGSLQKLRFSLEGVASLAVQLLYRVESVHSRLLLHRDIKPANIVTDRHGSGVYLIDFGFAKRYCDPKTGLHIRRRKVGGFVGTSRYASANAHNSYVQSRRDDLESLGYVLVELCGGLLPWQQVPPKHQADRHAYLARVKKTILTQRLCRNCPTPFPEAFHEYRSYVRGLGFQEKPDYEYLRSVWRPMMSGECRARCDVESMLADPLVPHT
ncbi:kinase-like protein [Periconia macrospinosa]|uniref:non-specific serine/threonine protein kinase n=1 Tax=Periconia macrospinosa TaxID=97972 RepID=A0A2V1DPP2_9PLEO|nr:kinase-like protein [Periconia macrospinosa]